MLYRVEASLTAGHLMSQVPGLRARVEETLHGILETAEEIRRLHGTDFSDAVQQPMRVHIGSFIVSYTLDIDRCAAKVLFLEPVDEKDRKGH